MQAINILKQVAGACVLAGVLVGCSDNTELELRHQASLAKALQDENRLAGEQFLQQNSTRSGIKELPGGLQYKVLNEGHGATPGPLDRVEVDYEGTLVDGTVFDSTWQRGKPASFQVNQVIRGWTRALMQMQEGDEWMLYIPADLAYGARSPSDTIPPNSTLIFKVKLLSVTAAKE